jgi:LmbE family N-acetylglucosaminyl deacetylase
MRKILVIAPHPDDEVLGCGGTIAKYTKQGDEVYLCIVTKGYSPDW